MAVVYTAPKIGAGNRKDYVCPDLAEVEWAYVAGILDGNGVCVQKQPCMPSWQSVSRI